MAIDGIGTWIPTADEFVAHWTAVNLVVGPGGFKLIGAYTLAMFTTDRNALAAQLDDVVAKENIRQTASGDRDVKRAGIRPRILQFGPTVRGAVPGSRHIPAIPRSPSFNDSPGIWRERMSDMGDLWLNVNTNNPAVAGFTPPLLLSGAYTQANFVTERTAMDGAFTAIETADVNLKSAREQRDILFAALYQRMKQYRLTVSAALPPGHALNASIPDLTPPPGATPDPSNLSGSWDPVQEKGALVWSPSLDPNLAHYSIRYHPGPKYKASEEQIVDLVAPGTETFATLFGLAASGSVAWFKVYVVLGTGNEKGSNAVKIVRP